MHQSFFLTNILSTFMFEIFTLRRKKAKGKSKGNFYYLVQVLLKTCFGEFPEGPAFRTPHFYCLGPELHP